MNLQEQVTRAKKHAAPAPKNQYRGVPIVGDTKPAEALHIVRVDDPDKLQEALEYYLDLNKWSTDENYEFAASQVEHEAQHYEAAEAVGAVAVVNELALFRTGRGPFTRHSYQVRTIPYGVRDPDALTVITGYPERLSPEDWMDLDRAGKSLADVAAIAAQNQWPMPLSSLGHTKGHIR